MPKVPESAREKITVQMNALIGSYFKPTFVKPPPASLPINYVIDVYTTWLGQYLYLCAKYQAPGRDKASLASTFETKFARLRCISENKVGLAFARPSGAWLEMFPLVSLEECLQILQEDSHFEP